MAAVALVRKWIDGVEGPRVTRAASGHVLRRVKRLRVTRPQILVLDVARSVVAGRTALLVLIHIIWITSTQKVVSVRQLGVERGTVDF